MWYYKDQILTASIGSEKHTFTVYYREHINDDGSGYLQGYIVHRNPDGAKIIFSRYTDATVDDDLCISFQQVYGAINRRLRDIKKFVAALGYKYYD